MGLFGGCQGGFGGCQRDNGITARLLPNWRGQRFGPRQADPLPFFWPELSKSNTGVRRPKPAKSTDTTSARAVFEQTKPILSKAFIIMCIEATFVAGIIKVAMLVDAAG